MSGSHPRWPLLLLLLLGVGFENFWLWGAPPSLAIRSSRLVPPMSSTPLCVSTPSSLRSI